MGSKSFEWKESNSKWGEKESEEIGKMKKNGVNIKWGILRKGEVRIWWVKEKIKKKI